MILNKDFVTKILEEASEQAKMADDYMHSYCEDMYPEICKAVQHRRAQYYLLTHEKKFIDKMLKNGQIEDKEAKQLQGEIDSKIFYLNLHTPKIELMDQKQKIAYYSELSEIFDRNELVRAVEET